MTTVSNSNVYRYEFYNYQVPVPADIVNDRVIKPFIANRRTRMRSTKPFIVDGKQGMVKTIQKMICMIGDTRTKKAKARIIVDMFTYIWDIRHIVIKHEIFANVVYWKLEEFMREGEEHFSRDEIDRFLTIQDYLENHITLDEEKYIERVKRNEKKND
jgi:hypothetical protein